MLPTLLRRPLLPQPFLLRSFSLSLRTTSKNSPFSRPSPPPLPPSDQKDMEDLLRKANAPLSMPMDEEEVEGVLHPDVRAKPKAGFEGEVNPETGEVGGPKIEPLSWQGEWTYGGRATDF